LHHRTKRSEMEGRRDARSILDSIKAVSKNQGTGMKKLLIGTKEI